MLYSIGGAAFLLTALPSDVAKPTRRSRCYRQGAGRRHHGHPVRRADVHRNSVFMDHTRYDCHYHWASNAGAGLGDAESEGQMILFEGACRMLTCPQTTWSEARPCSASEISCWPSGLWTGSPSSPPPRSIRITVRCPPRSPRLLGPGHCQPHSCSPASEARVDAWSMEGQA